MNTEKNLLDSGALDYLLKDAAEKQQAIYHSPVKDIKNLLQLAHDRAELLAVKYFNALSEDQHDVLLAALSGELFSNPYSPHRGAYMNLAVILKKGRSYELVFNSCRYMITDAKIEELITILTHAERLLHAVPAENTIKGATH